MEHILKVEVTYWSLDDFIWFYLDFCLLFPPFAMQYFITIKFVGRNASNFHIVYVGFTEINPIKENKRIGCMIFIWEPNICPWYYLKSWLWSPNSALEVALQHHFIWFIIHLNTHSEN